MAQTRRNESANEIWVIAEVLRLLAGTHGEQLIAPCIKIEKDLLESGSMDLMLQVNDADIHNHLVYWQAEWIMRLNEEMDARMDWRMDERMDGWMDGCMVHIAPWVDSWQSESHAWMRPTPRPPPISASWRMNVYIYMWQFLNWFPIASFTRIYVGPEVFWNPKGFLVESRFWEWLYEDMQLFNAFLLAQKCFETLRYF